MIGVERMGVSHELVRRIADIDEFKGLWRGLDDHSTGLKLIGDVAQHHDAFHEILKALHDKPLSIDMICALHKVISGKQSQSAGVFKKESAPLPLMQNGAPVGTLETAAPEEVAPLMKKLLAWVNDALARDDIHPLIIIAVFGGVFLQISPFAGRNNRLMRFVAMILMMKAGYSYAPFASLEGVMEDQAPDILKALEHNQNSLQTGQPDWSEWTICFMKTLQAQKEILHKRLYGEEASVSVQDLPALSIALLEHIRAHGRMTMKEAIKATNGRRSTIKLRLHELVESGYIHRHGAGRSVWYALV